MKIMWKVGTTAMLIFYTLSYAEADKNIFNKKTIKSDCDFIIRAIQWNKREAIIKKLEAYNDPESIKALLTTEQGFGGNILAAAVLFPPSREPFGPLIIYNNESTEEQALNVAKLILEKAKIVSTRFPAELILHRNSILFFFKGESPYRTAQRYGYKKVLEMFDDICKKAGANYKK